MDDLHPNNRLRGFSTVGTDGKPRTTSHDIHLQTEEEFRLLRAVVKKNALQRGDTPAARKHAAEQLRKLRIARKQALHSHDEANRLKFNADSILLNAFYPDRNKKNEWKPQHKRKRPKVIDLQIFSIIDMPEETIGKFVEIAKGECKATELQLNFRDGFCYDMSPYLVLALLKNEISPDLVHRGRINDELSKVLASVGLLDFMKIVPRTQHFDPEDFANDSPRRKRPKRKVHDIMPFNLRRGGGIEAESLATAEQRDEKVANEFVDTLKDWLKNHNPNQDISEEMASKIRDVMTEMFDNALRHGLPDSETGEWHTVGVLQKVKDNFGRDVVVCNLSILNLGQTIAQSLEQAPEDILGQINQYATLHGEKFPRETLMTLCALQDKISRIHPDPAKGNATLNGIGLMTAILNVFNPLFESNLPEYSPSFTLVSGKAWISARFPYTQAIGAYGERVIAFNANNDINEPPDPNCVKTLSTHFPGTIISIRFVIGADKLEKLLI